MAIIVEPVAARATGPIGVWTPGPPMVEHPDYHSAVVLTGNRWSPTNPMGTAPSALSAILLKDGPVLAIGGIPGVSSPSPIAELFNPEEETWSPAGSSTQPTFNYGAATTMLKDGRVFISGGASQTLMGDALPSGFVYDPRTDRWVTTNPMALGRVSHSASLLPDGRVLVAGGRDAQTNGNGLNTTEIFDANARVTTSPATTAAPPVVGSSTTATPFQRLGSRLPTAPLLAGGLGVIAIALLAASLVRSRRHRRRRSL